MTKTNTTKWSSTKWPKTKGIKKQELAYRELGKNVGKFYYPHDYPKLFGEERNLRKRMKRDLTDRIGSVRIKQSIFPMYIEEIYDIFSTIGFFPVAIEKNTLSGYEIFRGYSRVFSPRNAGFEIEEYMLVCSFDNRRQLIDGRLEKVWSNKSSTVIALEERLINTQDHLFRALKQLKKHNIPLPLDPGLVTGSHINEQT